MFSQTEFKNAYLRVEIPVILSENQKVRSGRLIDEEILVIIRVKEILYNSDGKAEGVKLDTKIILKETGELIEPKIATTFYADLPVSTDQTSFMAENIYAYLMNAYF